MLGREETELKVGLLMMNMGVDVYAVNISTELEEGESSGSVIDFF